MVKPYKAIVVAHTHWDREWYLPFQIFRSRLVKLMDKLLNLLKEKPGFKSFTLDGQTIVVEDYLEIRPEREEDLKKLVAEGRILIGPWYTQPDEFLVSGEAIIRNFMIGRQIAKEFGNSLPDVGYVPDSFGHISQMPQILRGFGIDSFVFWRGLDSGSNGLPTEFYWQGPDGSRVLAVHLRASYSNAADLSEDVKESAQRIEPLLKFLLRSASTSNVLLMNGSDHREPQPFLPDLIAKLNEKLKDIHIVQGTLMDYIEAVRRESPQLPTVTGEFRSPKYTVLLPGVLSTRMYIKQGNARCQTLLERWAEPFSAFSWTITKEYPKATLWRAWKYLLENHAHDTIYGCGIDQVYKEVLIRFEWSRQIAEEIIDRSFEVISENINTARDDALSFVVVFNPLSWAVTEAVRGKVKLPAELKNGFSIKDPEDKIVPYQVVRMGDDEAEILLLAEDVPACGYKTYGLHLPTDEETKISASLKASEGTLENEYLRVTVEPDGSLTITDKQTGKTYRNMNTFEDSGDAGDEYNYSPPQGDEVISSANGAAEVELVEKGPVASTIKVSLWLSLPKGISKDRSKRVAERVLCPITSFVTLYTKVPRLDIKTVFENKAEDHRLRVIFPTGMKTEFSFAEGSFTVEKRPIAPQQVELPEELFSLIREAGISLAPAPGKPERWIEDTVPTYPQQTFVDVNDGIHGLTVINKGLPEYEVKTVNGKSAIALTLLRCVGWLSRGDLRTRRGAAGPIIPTPDSQCPGKHVFEYSIATHSGTYEDARTYQLAHQFNASLRVWQTGKHSGSLPQIMSFVSIEPDPLMLSAVKKAEEDDALIIRLYNITDKEVEGKIKFYKPIKEALSVGLDENTTDGGPLQISPNGNIVYWQIGPHKIGTIKLKF